MSIEVLIPVRNPTEVFDTTIHSLIAQTERDFSVLISDNFSTKGGEHIRTALDALSAAGIVARKIQPPSELGRVEHWNWLHRQSGADWLKPLFAGDWIEPNYIACLRSTISKNAGCSYVFCNGYTHIPGREPLTRSNRWVGQFRDPREMQGIVLRYGMQFGPPSAAAYAREAFLGTGGYDESLPICADSYLFCKISAMYGAFGMPERLFHFQIHSARFSHDLRKDKRGPFLESMAYYFKLLRDVRAAGGRIPIFGFLRLLLRTTRDYLFPKT